jgi:GWxTD domain-containing protein
MKVRWLSTGVAILLMQIVTGPAGGQPGAAPFSNQPTFVMRSYVFPSSVAGQANLEIRLAMVYDILQFVKEPPNRYRASYEITAAIVDMRGNQVAGKIFRNDIVAESFEETNSRQRVRGELISLDVPVGDYKLSLDIMDVDTQKHLRREEEIKAADFVAGALQVSSLAFVSYTRPVAVRDSLQFNLNSAMRPRRELQGVYFELANAAGDSVTIRYAIRNFRDEEVAAWSEKLSGNTRAHLTELERFSHTPGQYTLHVEVSDRAATRTRKEFFTVMGSSSASDADMPPAVSGLYEPLRYIAKANEYKRIASAPESQRDSLIAEFWKQRDPTPDTPANELFAEYNRRLDLAIANFSISRVGRTGWQTDRGRIYIQYGPPTDIQQQTPSNRTGVRYEIWYYKDIDRSFIFRERIGSGDYELVGQQ